MNDKLPEVHFSLGSSYAATGQLTQAISELKRAQELAPNSDEGYRRLGSAYLAAGQKEQAIRALEKAVEMNPYYWVNPNALGGAYFTIGEFAKAIKSYQQVIQLEPQNQIGFANWGSVYVNMGRFQESIDPLETAMKLDPEPMVISNLGTCYFYFASLYRIPNTEYRRRETLRKGGRTESQQRTIHGKSRGFPVDSGTLPQARR